MTKEEQIANMTKKEKLGLRSLEAYPERVAAYKNAGHPVWDDVKAEFEETPKPAPKLFKSRGKKNT